MSAPDLFTIDVGDTLGQSLGERHPATLARLSGRPEADVRDLLDRYLLTATAPDTRIIDHICADLGIPRSSLPEACFKEPFAIFSSARQTLAALSRHAPVVTLSNSHPWHAEHHRRVWQAFRPHLTALHTSYELGVAKPDPSIFRAVARIHGVQVRSIVHVGDSWRDDIEGAVNAGCRAVWLSAGQYPPAQYDADSVLITHSISSVPDCLQPWLACR
ncbi:HAD family hydrolase [Nocardia sp. NPDC051052]|uniref:HAD family hydrolase n=1 Tax=Nocardia sp. NPDC051052 TaxID=3364322 RepID=UPI0037ACACE9